MKRGISLFALLLVGACIVTGVAGQMLLKNGMNKIGKIDNFGELFAPQNLSKMLSNIFIILGLCAYALSAIFWMGALSTLDLSFSYPLISLSYVIVAVLAFFVFKENITLIRWGGIFLIIFGSFLISRS
jgi:drug/metabolite transporter (DMT)-like permease